MKKRYIYCYYCDQWCYKYFSYVGQVWVEFHRNTCFQELLKQWHMPRVKKLIDDIVSGV